MAGKNSCSSCRGPRCRLPWSGPKVLRQAVKEMHQHHQGLKPTTLSLGVAVYPDHGDTGLQLIQSADAALYRAKQAGRDRVMAAEYAEVTIVAESPTSPFYQLEIS